ncbi:MAG: hypothetical protein LBP55_01530, partial [Candidatus Adiutrix sp.]|nr:hypothetical protein [Candidatus Adiutrix sp.]
MLGAVAAQGWSASGARAADDGYAWWFIKSLPARQADGGLAVTCLLNLPAGAQVTAEPRVFYTTSEFKRDRRVESRPRGDRELIQKFYRKSAERIDGQYAVTVYSGGVKSFALRAELELDGRPYYAQTMFALNGSSGRPDPGAVEIESEPAGPRLALEVPNPGRFRTEDTAALSLSSPPGFSPEQVSVYDQEGRLLARPPLSGGRFHYTPPFDRKLASGGYRSEERRVGK